MSTKKPSRTFANAGRTDPALRARAGVIASVIACACSTAEPPPPRAPEPPTLPAPPDAEARRLRVSLSADLHDCEMGAPHFFYDVAEPRPQALDDLSRLAQCLQTERHRHLKLLLVGRADHRGDDDYNRDLARRRAERVADLLVANGVERDRLGITSRGEAEAIGHLDELASLGYDRRVDLIVVNPVTPGAPARPVH